MTVPTCLGICPLCGQDFPKQVIASGKDFEYGTTGDQVFQFVRCLSCGTVVLDPRPSDESIPSLYPAYYEPYRFEHLPYLVRIGRDFVQRKKVRVVTRYAPRGARIVDVGCGAGGLLRLLAAHGDRTWRLCGWDFPGEHLAHVARSGCDVIAGSIDRTHAPHDVDLFILNQVLEHFARPDSVLATLVQALKPGGYIIIETPSVEGLDARLFKRRHWGGYHIPRHLVLFNSRGLTRLLVESGFEIVETARLAAPAFWTQSLHHVIAESPAGKLATLFTLRSLPQVVFFSTLDAVTRCFMPTSNQRVVARRPP